MTKQVITNKVVGFEIALDEISVKGGKTTGAQLLLEGKPLQMYNFYNNAMEEKYVVQWVPTEVTKDMVDPSPDAPTDKEILQLVDVIDKKVKILTSARNAEDKYAVNNDLDCNEKMDRLLGYVGYEKDLAENYIDLMIGIGLRHNKKMIKLAGGKPFSFNSSLDRAQKELAKMIPTKTSKAQEVKNTSLLARLKNVLTR